MKKQPIDSAPFELEGEMCRLIPLTKGQSAIVDAELYEWLMGWTWRAFWDWHTRSYYARTYERGKGHGSRKELRMHRLILGIKQGEVAHPDHANHNTLDNRKSNLRLSSVCQNNQHRRTGKNNTSGHKGVSFIKAVNRWRATIDAFGIRKHLGTFTSLEEAVSKRQTAETELFGKFSEELQWQETR
jgi:hypothetical protein